MSFTITRESSPTSSFPTTKPPTPSKSSHIFQQVFNDKYNKTEEAKNNRLNADNTVLIGGDVFSVLYLLFQTIQTLAPKITASAGAVLTAVVCGEIAGAINLGVAIISLKQGLEAWKSGEVGDRKLAYRLFFDAALLFLIGSVMILVSTALKAAALGSIGGFFATNPWALSLLFLIISLPLLTELCSRVKTLRSEEGPGAKLLSELKNTEIRNDLNWENIAKILNLPETEEPTHQQVSDAMESLQADLGVEGALSAFRVLQAILDNNLEKLSVASEELKKQAAKRALSIYVRLAQQLIYIVGGLVGLGGLLASPKVFGTLANGFMLLGNKLALFMDLFWEFLRNTPTVVGKYQP